MQDILLHLDSYPVATSPEAIEQVVQFTAAVGGVLTALAAQVDMHSRARELILGGATEHMLHDPNVPLRLSH